MFGVENLVLSKPLNEANSTPNQYRHASRQNSATTQSNDSFVSINSEYDSNNTDSSMLSSAYSKLIASFPYGRADLINRLDTMSDCPDYLMPRLSYSNMSQSSESNIVELSSKPQQRSTPRMIHQNSKFHYTDDFILLTEFSEIEGPKPLLTIPTDGGTGFNKNDYSVHLMCVDFHSHLQFRNDSESKPAFTLTQDTSIINYWDTGCTMITACVHHFTLYDLDARGFVRPFCLAYISYDQKPVTFFEPIRTKFNEITSLFKRSNLNVFKEELEQRCADLKFTKEFFLAWCDEESEERKRELVDEHQLDDRTRARLNYSSSTEAGRTQQVNAIDTMISEMESILYVILDELKSRNWLKQAQPVQKTNDMELNRSFSEVYPSAKNQSRTQRSNTFPYTEETMPKSSLLTIKVDNEYSSQLSMGSKKSLSSNRRPYRLFKNILIGNNIMTSFNSETLNTYQKPNKEMKRLHQLCVDTAKKAINELKIMQRYFSTPHCLLKFNQIAHNLTACGTLPNGKTDYSNLFWSMTLGDCAINTFFSMDKQVDLSKRGKKVIDIKPAVEVKANVDQSNSMSPLSASQLQSSQYFSPKANDSRKDTSESVYLDAVTSSDVNPSNSTLINSQNTKQDQEDEDSQQETKSSFSWSELKKYLESSEADDEKILNTRQTYQTESGSFMNKIQGSQYFEEGEDFYASIDDLGSSSINQAIGDNKRLLVKDQKKEENEYDFANSLVTIDYKPYNQYAMNFNHKNLYLSQGSLITTVSLSSSSVGMYYKTINSLRYQSNLTDKLIQINEFNYEETLKKLIGTYGNIMPHLLYSLLKGKPVICVVRSCSDLYYLESIVDCLSNFLPNSFYCLNSLTRRAKLVSSGQHQSSSNGGDYTIPKYTSSPCQQQKQYSSQDMLSNKVEPTTSSSSSFFIPQLRAIHQRKPIKLNDLKYCKLFGLCLMCSKEGCCSSDCANGLQNQTTQCDQTPHSYPHKHKHYHQNKKQSDADLLLEYIPITVRNYVSIFDLDNQTFYGPKYTGTHLTQCVNKCKSLQQDSIIYLYLIANVFKFYLKAAFVYNYSILFESNLEQALSKRRASELVKQNVTSGGGGSGRSFLTRASEFMHKSVQINHTSTTTSTTSSTNTSPTTSLPSPRRKTSHQISQADFNTRKNKLINYYTNLVHLSRMNDSVSSGSFRSLDLEFLKLIMNGPLSTTNTSPTYSSYLSVTLNSASSSALLSSLNFDQSDMNIVSFLIRSLRAKQIYIYNLAMSKKQRLAKETNDDWNQDELLAEPSTSNQIDHSYESQLPLFVDYDEMSLFTVKKK